MTYKEEYKSKLLNPKWQKKRLKILDRDNFTCKLCGDTEITLHIHHLEYIDDPWSVSDDMLQTYCEDCHSLIEFIKKSPAFDLDGKDSIIRVLKIKKDHGVLFLCEYLDTAGGCYMYHLFTKFNDEGFLYLLTTGKKTISKINNFIHV